MNKPLFSLLDISTKFNNLSFVSFISNKHLECVPISNVWLPGGRQGGINWEIGIDTYTPYIVVYIVVYSTGNSSQYSVMT